MTKKNDVFIFSKTDVSNYVQNKMGLSYLNWAFVVDTLKTNDPDSTYSVKQYPEINLKTGNLTGRQVNYNEGVNGEGAYVTVTVTFRGKSHTESLPCYNFKGRAVAMPDVMLVNKTIKRCYVKAAAMLTGLGISLYINGNPNGGHQNAKHNDNRTYNYSYNRSSNYKRGRQASYSHASKSQASSDQASQKQVNYINYLLSKTTTDGSMKYDYLAKNRKQLKNMDKSSATAAVKYLLKLQEEQKNDNNNGMTGNAKQTTLLK